MLPKAWLLVPIRDDESSPRLVHRLNGRVILHNVRQPASQGLVMIGAACVTPVVLAYSAFAYWIFRGKTPENGWEA